MKKTDFILILIVLAVAGAAGLILHFGSDGGEYVRLEVDSKVYDTVSLSENRTVELNTEYGTNTVVIENKTVSVTDADCPDKICVKHSKISKTGESIICLPHRLVVTVVDENEPEIDARA